MAPLGQAHASAEGEAVHQNQHRLAVVVDAQVEGIFLDEEVLIQAAAGLVAVVQRADVAAGAEALGPFAAQHHGMDLGIGRPLVQVMLQAAHHVEGESVEAGRAVERQVADVIADFGQNMGLGMSVRGHDRGLLLCY